jgi:hypothetical protein
MSTVSKSIISIFLKPVKEMRRQCGGNRSLQKQDLTSQDFSRPHNQSLQLLPRGHERIGWLPESPRHKRCGEKNSDPFAATKTTVAML